MKANRTVRILFCTLVLLLQSVLAFASTCPTDAPLTGANAAGSVRHCHCDPNGPERDCCKHAASHGKSAQAVHHNGGACKCSLQSPDAHVSSAALVTVPTLQIAVLPTTPSVAVSPEFNEYSEPVAFGDDAGPPSPTDQAPDLGRAPPVA